MFSKYISGPCHDGSCDCDGSCGQGEGDCDFHSDCLEGLRCVGALLDTDYCKAGAFDFGKHVCVCMYMDLLKNDYDL